MATLLPDNGFFNSPINNGQGKDGLDDVVAFIRQSLAGGASAEANTILEISGGSIAPVEAIHAVDTEGQLPTDDLDRVAFTDMVPGQLLMLRSVTNSRVVTVKHGLGGIGQFRLHGVQDFVLDDNKKWLVLRRESDDMREVIRSWGDDEEGARAHLKLGNVATLNAGDGLEESAGELQVDLDGVNSGLRVTASGVALELENLSQSTTPTPTFEASLSNDVASTIKMTLLNLFKVVGAFSELATVDAADRLLVVDQADGLPKYAESQNVGSQIYVSGNQSMSNGTPGSVAFNTFTPQLNAEPKEMTAELVCLSDDLQYVAGEVVSLGSYVNSSAGSRGLGLYRDTTTAKWQVGSSGVYVLNGTGVETNIDLTKWALRIVAKR